MAGECEHSTYYHAWPQFSYIEIINGENKPVIRSGETGEIIGTALNNNTFPFIRYRSGDIGQYHGQGCHKCKRNFPLLEKIDRWLQEIVVSRNGVYVSVTGLNMHSDVFDHVIQFQFLQKVPGELVLNIVPKSSFSESDTSKIMSELKGKLGDEFDIKIKQVDSIPRTGSGKHRYLVQELNLGLLENK
jgi:phenylacetate-CoA ligase